MENNPLFDKYGKTLEKDDVIFKEKDAGETMYIIQEGSVVISREMQGREHVVAVLEKGEFFGEMAIVNRTPRTATAKAGEKTALLAFDRQGFQQMVEKNPKIALNMIDKLCRRLQHANSQIHHLAQQNLMEQLLLNLYYLPVEPHQGTSLTKVLEELGLHLDTPMVILQEKLLELETKGVVEIRDDMLYVVSKAGIKELIKSN